MDLVMVWVATKVVIVNLAVLTVILKYATDMKYALH